MILTAEWMNKCEQYVYHIPDNVKVNKKYFAWTALQSCNHWMMREGNSTERKHWEGRSWE